MGQEQQNRRNDNMVKKVEKKELASKKRAENTIDLGDKFKTAIMAVAEKYGKEEAIALAELIERNILKA